MKTRIVRPFTAAVLGCFLTPALAQTAAAPTTAPAMSTASATASTTATATSTTTSTTTSATGTTAMPAEQRVPPLTRLTGDFSAFAGSGENAAALVNGLRSGGAITLTAPDASGSGTSGTTFTSPTGPMSYGNIRIALSLARAQLAREGIAEPTPQQLQDALAGGSGILQQRADGKGWGRIAHDMGMKLGPVVSGRTPQAQPAATAATQHHRHEQQSRQRIVTASGEDGGLHATKARVEQQHRHVERHEVHQRPAAPRVVTAAGTTAGATAAPAFQSGNRGGSGVVTAAGTAGSGQGHGHGTGGRGKS